MATKRVIPDNDFGSIIIRTHRSAVQFSMRTKPDGVHVTVPPRTLTSRVLEVIEQFRPRLLENWEKVQPKLIDLDFQLDTPCFRLHLESRRQKCFTIRFAEEGITLYCPQETDFTEKKTQELLRNAIIRALKKSAQNYLPPLLNELANRYELRYKRVKITGSKSCWGSCSAVGSINLSCYIMLLPPHLMDYVLLHELAHTKEMNHSPQFWEILNELTGGKARSLRAELKFFRTGF